MTPDYWQRAAAELAAGDERMAGLVECHAGFALVSRGDPFGTLARSIVGQQISVKAAEAVWQRFNGALPEISPAAVLAAGEAGLAGLLATLRSVVGGEAYGRLSTAAPGGPRGALLTDEQKRRFGVQ